MLVLVDNNNFDEALKNINRSKQFGWCGFFDEQQNRLEKAESLMDNDKDFRVKLLLEQIDNEKKHIKKSSDSNSSEDLYVQNSDNKFYYSIACVSPFTFEIRIIAVDDDFKFKAKRDYTGHISHNDVQLNITSKVISSDIPNDFKNFVSQSFIIKDEGSHRFEGCIVVTNAGMSRGKIYTNADLSLKDILEICKDINRSIYSK